MSFMKPSRLELAMHEAGHAYAFAALIPWEQPLELGLAVDTMGNDHGWCNRREILHREVRLASVPIDALPSFEWQAAAEVVIAVAGTLAEFRHRLRGRVKAAFTILDNAPSFLKKDAYDTDGDFARIRGTLQYIEAPDPLVTFRNLIGVCDEITHRNWSSIRALGRLLFERERMAEQDLIDWFEAHPAVPNRVPLTIRRSAPQH